MTHEHEIDRELAVAEEVIETLAPDGSVDFDPETASERIESIRPTVVSLETDRAYAEIFGAAALHPSAVVRRQRVELAAECTHNVFARQFIVSMTHDDEDFVTFTAIRLCGELGLQESLDDLASLVGWVSDTPDDGTRMTWGGNPVGVGRATVVNAMTNVYGTTDPAEIERLESHYRENGHLPLSDHSVPELNREPGAEPDDTEGMIRIPGGTYTLGIDREEAPFTRYSETNATTYEVEVPPFYIDETPVTVGEYDAFLEAVDEYEKYTHPSAPDDPEPRRNTRHEDIPDDHPVTGLDFYDIYAYTRWAGKDLPLEEEWEVACRGAEGLFFPWGDEWDPERCRWAGESFDTTFEDVADLTETLADATADGRHETRTAPVDAHPSGASPFGVLDMVGNVWEYTKTTYLSRQEVHPVFSHMPGHSHENLIGNNDALPVIRGGAWSNVPEQTSGFFRGKDLLTDRHNEIGFRCVKRV
ncbi:MAG: formylglycine-generating enzyme family protein [Halobaculum sp.]